MHVFQLLSTMKVKLVDEMVQAQRIIISRGLTRFFILGKTQDGDHFLVTS